MNENINKACYTCANFEQDGFQFANGIRLYNRGKCYASRPAIETKATDGHMCKDYELMLGEICAMDISRGTGAEGHTHYKSGENWIGKRGAVD